ncbi:hypothetical protein DPX16_22147 [Anabarilius grahami]|uniref:Uncharacterized protein n=1 Tax=Anabarilius grahami TaxID=495550 RepID=A0A3N0XNF3_ANAGA|nr:hypothetical protein DPX16_22147 [Anabarilius grahami]
MRFNPRQRPTDGRPSCAMYSRALGEEGPHGIVSGGPSASLPGLLAQAGQGGLRLSQVKANPFFHPQLGCVSLSSLQRYIMPSPDSLGVRISS